MSRYFYVGLLAVVVVGVAVVFFYKTPPPTESAAIGEFGGVSLRIEYATTPEARESGR